MILGGALAAGLIIVLLEELIIRLLFLAEAALGKLLDLLYEFFQVFAGITPVTYQGSKSYLFDVFLGNKLINAVYRGMALIGIALVFAFALAAVIKKGFDSTGEKVKATYGMIIGNVLKAILLILLMTAIVSATMNATGVLLQQIEFLFNNAEEIADPSEIYFDDNDYATMFRIFDTIGNYSLDSSFNNRFNINACFNSIRFDMQALEKGRTFEYAYTNNEKCPAAEASWQAALLRIYNAADIYEELPMDVYNERVANALINCVDKIQKDASFKPLNYYYRGYSKSSKTITLGRILLLSCSFDASIRPVEHPSLTDSVRQPFYVGKKDIYSYDDVSDTFDLHFGVWSHLVAFFVLILTLLHFLKILINCTARIFNVMLLYIMAPPFAAVMPLDDGGKMKQWTTAFIIQSLSLFGSIISVRLMMMFIPIILDGDLVLFTEGAKNSIAKTVLIIGVVATSEKATGMITGILADNAGYQSIMAGDVGSGVVGKGLAIGGKALSAAGKVAGAGLKLGADATGLTTGVNNIKKNFSEGMQSMRDHGGIRGASKAGWKSQNTINKENSDNKQAQQEKDTKDFRSSVLGKLDSMSGGGGGGSKGGGDNSSSGGDNSSSGGDKGGGEPQNKGGGMPQSKSSQSPSGGPGSGKSKDDSTLPDKGRGSGGSRSGGGYRDDTNIGTKSNLGKQLQSGGGNGSGGSKPGEGKSKDDSTLIKGPNKTPQSKNRDDFGVMASSRPTLTPPPAKNPVNKNKK